MDCDSGSKTTSRFALLLKSKSKSTKSDFLIDWLIFSSDSGFTKFKNFKFPIFFESFIGITNEVPLFVEPINLINKFSVGPYMMASPLNIPLP